MRAWACGGGGGGGAGGAAAACALATWPSTCARRPARADGERLVKSMEGADTRKRAAILARAFNHRAADDGGEAEAVGRGDQGEGDGRGGGARG